MTFAYSYIRFITPEQAKGDSLRRQIELREKYLAGKNLVLDETLCTLISVEVKCDQPMLRTVQQLFRQGQNLAGVTVESGVTPTDFIAVPEGAIGQVYQMVLCMDEGKRNQGLERNQTKFPQYQPLSFLPKDIER